jgi:hypothetical protein
MEGDDVTHPGRLKTYGTVSMGRKLLSWHFECDELAEKKGVELLASGRS